MFPMTFWSTAWKATEAVRDRPSMAAENTRRWSGMCLTRNWVSAVCGMGISSAYSGESRTAIGSSQMP